MELFHGELESNSGCRFDQTTRSASVIMVGRHWLPFITAKRIGIRLSIWSLVFDCPSPSNEELQSNVFERKILWIKWLLELLFVRLLGSLGLPC